MQQKSSIQDLAMKIVKMGDVNDDGVIDVTDVTMLINAILGQIQIEGGDLNGDGNVDVTDVTTEINIVLGSQN